MKSVMLQCPTATTSFMNDIYRHKCLSFASMLMSRSGINSFSVRMLLNTILDNIETMPMMEKLLAPLSDTFYQAVSDDKIQITLLILRRGALSTRMKQNKQEVA